MKVVVTGAGGRTGGLAVKALLSQPDKFSSVYGTVRSKAAAGAKLATDLGLPEANIVEFDLAAAAAAAAGGGEGAAGGGGGAAAAALEVALAGADALVIATSAVPQIKYSSLIGVIAGRLVGRKSMPGFTWKQGQTPEQIDWWGQKVQIDAAKAAGVKHVVLVSSMGGTDPNHFLNQMGGNARILDWKRRAERYLVDSGLRYTIIHPGGLIDEAGGAKQLVLGVDDALLTHVPRNIPRADVAALAVAAIGCDAAAGRSFDVVAAPPAEGAALNNDATALLTGMAANCDYAINSPA
ncbi:MAG: isomerase [Monoraphidium minutum]|nr:MAG: isomerase [Monoraphidium minutum]